MVADYKAAALDRFEDSRVLFASARWTGAVYMARFGLECSLKAKLLEQLRTHVLPARWHTHDLWRLVKQVRKRPVPKAITTAVAEINAIDISIRYNAQMLDKRGAERFLAMSQGVTRWLGAI